MRLGSNGRLATSRPVKLAADTVTDGGIGFRTVLTVLMRPGIGDAGTMPWGPAQYNPRMPISPVPELVAELAAGRMVILVDEEDRENEGDLVLGADHVSPEAINFMA